MMDMKLNQDQVQGPGSYLSESENNGPAYPAGLRIRLDAESLRKLAMSLPQVGQVYALHGMVEVIEVAKSPNLIEDDKEVVLQIVAMELAEPADERNEQQKAYDQVSSLYD